MKLLPQKDPRPAANGPGSAKVVAEEDEDLWHAYNLISDGDVVAATTIRKVSKESASGSVDSQRMKMTLAIRVKSVDFDPEAGSLRLSGVVVNEIEGVRLVCNAPPCPVPLLCSRFTRALAGCPPHTGGRAQSTIHPH